MSNSLRQFIDRLRNAGELRTIEKEVDWKYEVGDLTRKAQRDDTGALLFLNIKDYPRFSLFTQGLGRYARFAIALGLDRRSSFKDIAGAIRRGISNPVAPTLVNQAPFRENQLFGSDINLAVLPVPWWHRLDNGRYLGTWHLNITRDPETGIRNVGIYRMQLLGPRTAAVSISPGSHLAVHLRKCAQKKQPLEMAAALGVEETLIMAGAAAPPLGTDEFTLAGGLNQRPVELASCSGIRLEVPASSEIVLEGTVTPGRTVEEGPFLDYAGVPKKDPNAHIFDVSALMFRNDPVFRGTAVGLAGAEDHLLLSLLSHARSLDFHGSRIRQKVQNTLLKLKLFNLFQFTGSVRYRTGRLFRKKQADPDKRGYRTIT